MPRYLHMAVAIAFGAFGWVVPAGAGVIFDNGAPLVDPVPSNGILSDFDTPQQIADDFTLSSGANTITDVHWWGGYALSNTPSADDFTIRIFPDASGAPTTTPAYTFAIGAAGRTATGDTITPVNRSFDVFEYSTTITATTLAAGTTFWLSIVNDTPPPAGGTNDDWLWVMSATSGGNDAGRGSDTASWGDFGTEVAFQLTDDTAPKQVPEPATLALFAGGLLALGVLRRRRSTRAA